MKRKLGDADPTVEVLPSAKRGCPLLICETMDNQVKAYIGSVHDSGGPITTLIVMAVGTTVICRFDADLLAVLYLLLQTGLNLYRMNFAKRKGCSTAKPMVHNFGRFKVDFLNDISVVVKMEEIPDELVLNWDHMPVNIVPGSQWTMAQKGAK